MKMEWTKPELEVLDVNQTMLGADGEYTDAILMRILKAD